MNGKLANALNRVELVSEKNIGSGLRKSYQTIGRCNVLKPKTLRNPVTTVFAHVRKFLDVMIKYVGFNDNTLSLKNLQKKNFSFR